MKRSKQSESRRSCLAVTVLLGGVVTSAIGCGGIPEEDVNGDEGDEVGMLMAALNGDTSTCGSAAADQTYTNTFPDTLFSSPANYQAGKNGCGAAYFVDLNNYAYGPNQLSYGSVAPGTQAGCVGSNLRIYVFNVTGAVFFEGSYFAYGSWNGSSCTPPSAILEDPALPAMVLGDDFKLALSARNVNGDVRKIDLWK